MKFSNKKTPGRPSGPGDRRYLLLGFRIMAEFGAIIAVPVVLLAKLGQRLDEAFGTGPWLLIAGFGLSAGISAAGIWRRAKKFSREYEELNKLNG